MTTGTSRTTIALWVVWLLATTAGMTGLAIYKSTPTEQAPAPHQWPEHSELVRTPGIATLVMMSHPKCPCTRASLAELNELMTEFKQQLTVYVLFVEPAGVDENWTKTDLWDSASRIPGVHVVRDHLGVESRRFAGLTSGETVLYDGDGQLQFTGGITGARGHVGDNLGLQRVMTLLKGLIPDRADSPVFGCGLEGPTLEDSQAVK